MLMCAEMSMCYNCYDKKCVTGELKIVAVSDNYKCMQDTWFVFIIQHYLHFKHSKLLFVILSIIIHRYDTLFFL